MAPPFDNARLYREALGAAVRGKPYDAIFVCHEEVLARLLPLRRNRSWRGLLLPPPASLKIALSKNAALSLALWAGVATPRTAIPADDDDLSPVARELGWPVVAKSDVGESGEGVRIIRREEDLAAQYRELMRGQARARSRPALQEFIRGSAFSVGGLFLNGRPLRVVAHRKLLRYPHPWGGLTVKGVTEDCPELLREAFKVFEAIEYTGLGHVEFIRDERDGRFKFLEINPRLWGTIGVARLAGVDLFTPYRQLVKGIEVEPDLRYRVGVRFHRILREVRLMRQRPWRVAGFVKDVLDPRVRSDFAWSDPGPHLPSLYRLRRLLWPGNQRPAPMLSLGGQPD
ncbi:MAG TPA: ATP-grasp domain-containing protein [Candidatus Binataceae bacterium]|nr:ATP-grasp domain-containing protein [Candidatus Binataceae bacterium]